MPPKGKVLFERHEPVPPDIGSETNSNAPDETPDPHPRKYGEGLSPGQRQARTTLRRRDTLPNDAAVPGAQTSRPVASGSFSSSTERLEDAAAAPQLLPVVTAEDREKARGVTDADRAAVSVLSTGLDMHLNTHTGAGETRAQLLVQNSGTAPLSRLPLRVSGALRWESARQSAVSFIDAKGKPLVFDQYRIPDDLDHTGIATEAVLTLAEPLEPGKTIGLDLYYAGTLAASTQRLAALGAPAGRAALTDWDTVSDTFTGLRGLGNVLWYPATGPTAHLRDGDAVTRAVEDSRTRNAQTSFSLHLTVEYTGSRPDAAFFTGERQVLKPLSDARPGDSSSPADEGFVTAEWSCATLGAHTPSLFIVGAAPHTAADGLLRIVTERADTVAALGEAATRIRTMLTEWLGAAPDHSVDVIDLPIPSGAGFADGTLIVAPLTTGSAAALAPSLVQQLAAAWLPKNLHATWLREGLPAFFESVWIERTAGRAAATAWLAANASNPYVSANPSTDPKAANHTGIAGPSPATCSAATCVRGRAAYVLEMLRGMVGDERLQQALPGWRYRVEQAEATGTPQADSTGDAMQKRETAWFETAMQQAATKDLGWFFRDWIDADRGLPDLTIVTVAPRHIERSAPVDYLPQQRKPVAGPIGAEPLPPNPRDLPDGGASSSSSSGGSPPLASSWLVAVEVQNNGSAEAEVPVTVLAGNLTNTLPLRIPAHGRATIRIPFEAEPQEVLVNDGSVPEARTSHHRRIINALPQ